MAQIDAMSYVTLCGCSIVTRLKDICQSHNQDMHVDDSDTTTKIQQHRRRSNRMWLRQRHSVSESGGGFNDNVGDEDIVRNMRMSLDKSAQFVRREHRSTNRQRNAKSTPSSAFVSVWHKFQWPSAVTRSLSSLHTSLCIRTDSRMGYRSLSFLLLSIVMLLLFSTRDTWLGTAYDARTGGIIGIWTDRALWSVYEFKQRYRSQRQLPLTFPDVTVKATRKTEKAHYSSYLVEQLARASAPVNLWYGNSGNSSQRYDIYPSVKTATDSATRSVEIDGIPTLTAAAVLNPLSTDLRAEGCTSNWLCQRCLSSPLAGTFEVCRSLCRRCYIRILSTLPHYQKNDPVRVILSESQRVRARAATETEQDEGQSRQQRQRIPRIIHQSWEKMPRTLEHPELARMQATWRSLSGYTYQFYTPKRREEFLTKHYPPIVFDTYAALQGGMRRVQFFKLLVLFKVGGIFANADVMLQTNLDVFFNDPNIALIIPRDDGSPASNCLWTHLVAAEPGHPVLARMIETFLRQYYLGRSNDIAIRERFILHSVDLSHRDELPLWKLRQVHRFSKQRHHSEIDGCDWAVALNSDVGLGNRNYPLANFALGRQGMTDGDLVVLLTSRDDTGATRITDVERNLLVASTDIVGVDWSAVRKKSKSTQRTVVRERDEAV